MEEKLISSIQAAEKEAEKIRHEAEQKAAHMREDALSSSRKEIEKIREDYSLRSSEILNKAREDAEIYSKQRMGRVEEEKKHLSDMKQHNMNAAIEYILHYIFEEHNGHIEDDSHNSGRT